MSTGYVNLPLVPGTGTVTSVAMTLPSFLAVSGSPITTSGTLALSLTTQTANKVLSGPTTGSAAAPTFRSLVTADLPTDLPYTAGTSADWDTAPPTTVAAALDRIAALLVTLNSSNPIP